MLAERLDMAYYDSEILTLAARHSGMSRHLFAEGDEHRGLLRSVLGSFTPVLSDTDFYGQQLSAEHLFSLQSEAIRRAAYEHSCVFVGRAADYVLRQHPRCISIFLCANRGDRIRRVMDLEHVGQHAAQRMIDASDRQRADFYDFYAQGTWGYASTYNLVVNTSTLGLEQTTDVIADFARRALRLA